MPSYPHPGPPPQAGEGAQFAEWMDCDYEKNE
jgi:hypothetical protein